MEEILINSTVDTLFQAKRYVSGPRPAALISTLISTLIDKEGKSLVTNEDKAQALFHATCVATAECDMGDIPLHNHHHQTDDSAEFFESPIKFFSISSIRETIHNTYPMKAPGPDRIQNWVWSLAWEVVPDHILVLFTSITSMGYIPKRWKVTRTTMLAKPGKGDYTQPGSYRPIALLNTIAKIYEKALACYMSQVAEGNHVLHPGQIDQARRH